MHYAVYLQIHDSYCVCLINLLANATHMYLLHLWTIGRSFLSTEYLSVQYTTFSIVNKTNLKFSYFKILNNKFSITKKHIHVFVNYNIFCKELKVLYKNTIATIFFFEFGSRTSFHFFTKENKRDYVQNLTILRCICAVCLYIIDNCCEV